MGSYSRSTFNGFFCNVVAYKDLLTVLKNIILHYKWDPSTAREMNIDDFDDEGLFFWHTPLEKMDKDYKNMMKKK